MKSFRNRIHRLPIFLVFTRSYTHQQTHHLNTQSRITIDKGTDSKTHLGTSLSSTTAIPDKTRSAARSLWDLFTRLTLTCQSFFIPFVHFTSKACCRWILITFEVKRNYVRYVHAMIICSDISSRYIVSLYFNTFI